MYKICHNLKCEHCGAGLTEPESVEVTFSAADHTFTRLSHVGTDGQLEDVDRLVENGYHAGSNCKRCDELLEEVGDRPRTCILHIPVVYDSALTDPEALASALNMLLETALSTSHILDECGDPDVGEFTVQPVGDTETEVPR